MDDKLPSREAVRRDRILLDFLKEPMPQNSSVLRKEAVFTSRHPWGTIRLTDVRLRPGWWWLECNTGDDVQPEARLSSASDPLINIPGTRSPTFAVYLPGRRAYDISILVSPWPRSILFRRFALRRMSLLAAASFLARRLLSVLTDDRALLRIARLGKRLASGQAIGASQTSRRPEREDGTLAVAEPGIELGNGGCTAISFGDGSVTGFLDDRSRLCDEAIGIIRAEFERSPHVHALYCDVREGKHIRLRPGWDPVLAGYSNYVGLPIFFRGSVESDRSPWSRLLEIAKRYGDEAIGNIALPLAVRDPAPSRVLPEVPLPVLPHWPCVSFIIPTGGRTDLLGKCIDSLVHSTDYPEFEVVIVDNGADERRLSDAIDRSRDRLVIKKVADRTEFNFSRLCNLGAGLAEGQVVVFMNDDVEAVDPGWLRRMVASVISPGVGAVGARLLYADRSLQHAGVMLGIGGTCGHLWRGMAEAKAATVPAIVYPGRRLAITGACLALRRSHFLSVDGFDERDFPIGYSDVDLCLRLRREGYENLYRGDAVLIHHESQSRGYDDDSVSRRRRRTLENERFLRKWAGVLAHDPLVSEALDLSNDRGATHRSLA